MSLGYDDNGVTYLQAVTNRGTYFERGYLKASDSLDVEKFSLDAPLVGLLGYESDIINALGFVRFQCPTANVDDEIPVIEEDEFLFDNMTEDMLTVEESELHPAVITVISAPIFFIGLLIGLSICICISIYEKKCKQRVNRKEQQPVIALFERDFYA